MPLTCGQTTLRQVNVPGQLDTFTFNGTGGNRANLRFSPRSGNYAPFAELYDATGDSSRMRKDWPDGTCSHAATFKE